MEAARKRARGRHDGQFGSRFVQAAPARIDLALRPQAHQIVRFDVGEPVLRTRVPAQPALELRDGGFEAVAQRLRLVFAQRAEQAEAAREA
jgi:hypothetical protein